jgi:hypothetical protein
VFPRADHPIAVEFPGYPVVRLRPIEGLEFVEETVTAGPAGAGGPQLKPAGIAAVGMAGPLGPVFS